MFRRIMALLLCIVMIGSLLPVSVFAQESAVEAEDITPQEAVAETEVTVLDSETESAPTEAAISASTLTTPSFFSSNEERTETAT